MDAMLTQLKAQTLTSLHAATRFSLPPYPTLPERRPGEDLRTLYLRHKGGSYVAELHGEWVRVIAYEHYGYGNWSNNDRRQRGLPALRKRKGRRRGRRS